MDVNIANLLGIIRSLGRGEGNTGEFGRISGPSQSSNHPILS